LRHEEHFVATSQRFLLGEWFSKDITEDSIFDRFAVNLRPNRSLSAAVCIARMLEVTMAYKRGAGRDHHALRRSLIAHLVFLFSHRVVVLEKSIGRNVASFCRLKGAEKRRNFRVNDATRESSRSLVLRRSRKYGEYSAVAPVSEYRTLNSA
jgi:hypothetical protein